MRGPKLYAPYLVIAALTLALMIPAIIARPMVHDSFWIDFVWADQFTAEIRRGTLYPRWLPQSHGGLGSPTFYFYPPIGFYIAAIFGLGGAPTYASILLAFATALAASGAAMFHWLKDWTERPLLGACFYMVAPYHLCDFYYRGALAEYCAFALIPLVTLGIKRCAEGRGITLLALSYAALIMTHLPVALLTSLLLIAPYSLLLARKAGVRATLPRIAPALALGIGIAAIYLLPALNLQDYIAASKLWDAPQYHPTAWNFFDPDRWIERNGVIIMMVLTGFSAVGAIALFGMRREGWAAFALLCCLLVSGIVPIFWALPIIEKIQFPWRVLVLVEFALATALARSRHRALFTAMAVIPLLVVAILFLLIRPQSSRLPFPLELLVKRHPDVIEYLPPGATREILFLNTLSATASARAQPPVQMAGDRTILRTYYFPAWRVTCNGRQAATFPDPALKLLSFQGHNCTVRWAAMRAERIGGVITLLSLAGLAFAAAIRRRRFSSHPSRSVIFTES